MEKILGIWWMNMISKKVRKILEERVSYPLAREYNVGTGIINLASNENPYGPSPRAIAALRKEMRRIGTYPDPDSKELKREISAYVGVDERCIVLGNGSDELMDLACRAFLDPGDKVLISIPTFAMYEISCRANGGEPEFFVLPGFTWQVEAMKKKLEGVKAAFIGRPNNPTGNMLSVAEVEELLKTGRLLIVDEAYVEFDGESVVPLVGRYKNLLVLRTLSKAFGLAGLRVGYAVGDPELIEAINVIRAPFNLNRMAQAAAAEALRDRKYLKYVVTKIKMGREWLKKELEGMGFTVLQSRGNFLMVNAQASGMDGRELCSYLAGRGIMIRELADFKGAGPEWVRITVGTPRQNSALVSAIKKVKEG
ncbi:MAG: histidinol-phosphate transaminase [Candidatus Hadarchaeales archaeon]